MADLEKRDGPARPVQIRDFIFVRELSEVYLLLDFISGRWDKGLEPDVQMLIEEICEIGWPPEDGPKTQAHQAAILLNAKDKLNAAAKPANGATIAFTLLVVGEDDPRQRKLWGRHADRRGTAARSGERTDQRARGRQGNGGPEYPVAAPGLGGPSGPGGWRESAAQNGERRTGNGNNGGNGGSGGSGGNPWAGGRDWPGRRGGCNNGDLIAPGGGFTRPPTRMSLARTAFPGLIGPAGSFSRGIWRIVVGLLIWLVFTCLLSWNVTAGNVILTHLDTLRSQQRELTAKVSSAEAKLAADELARLAKAAPQSGTAAAVAGAAAPPAPPLIVYCDPARAPQQDATPLAQRYRSVEEYHLCIQDNRLDRERAVTRRNLAAWLQPWKALYRTATYFLEPIPEPRLRSGRAPRQSGDEETARILTLVLGSAVLPLCYGILGAGAAVVRDLWRKMRESMLSPRDYSLALGQLALGATIGACIGLFVNASGTGSTAEPALAGAWTLSGSALSFIAGFGVEGVFQAMESFVRRVFNVPDPAKPR
ncbi:hypothetical protein ASD15_27890 [Massilia sp. Root351]|jgi:hypothetical protein|uniref:hypothetical protein n=1 Tax=Massilia sp. Root351 TaxID=1736522 RepID=UPI00070A49AD|nr:hypothetical protein [Massilia sp. Root351]KQV87874.1 hypothetical protein ASD15_27890 [Massilia sp. Root351]